MFKTTEATGNLDEYWENEAECGCLSPRQALTVCGMKTYCRIHNRNPCFDDWPKTPRKLYKYPSFFPQWAPPIDLSKTFIECGNKDTKLFINTQRREIMQHITDGEYIPFIKWLKNGLCNGQYLDNPNVRADIWKYSILRDGAISASNPPRIRFRRNQSEIVSSCPNNAYDFKVYENEIHVKKSRVDCIPQSRFIQKHQFKPISLRHLSATCLLRNAKLINEEFLFSFTSSGYDFRDLKFIVWKDIGNPFTFTFHQFLLLELYKRKSVNFIWECESRFVSAFPFCICQLGYLNYRCIETYVNELNRGLRYPSICTVCMSILYFLEYRSEFLLHNAHIMNWTHQSKHSVFEYE